MISLTHKFIFIHPVKTGGTSISVALAPFCENKMELEAQKPVEVVVGDEKDNYWFPWHPNFKEKFHIGKHASLQEYYDYFGEQKLQEFKIYCTARNPFERLISFTNWHYKPNGTSEFWPTSFVRFENIQDDFDKMCKDVGILETPKLPHKNKTGHEPYKVYYEMFPNLIPKVEAAFKSDLEYFGYAY